MIASFSSSGARSWLWLLVFVACATPRPATAPGLSAAPPLAPHEKETHLHSLRRLTFGGENAEAYFSFDGKALSLQSRQPNEACDRIYTLNLSDPSPRQLSSGEGATTCAHYFPGGQEVLFASTHLGGAACPPKPDMSQGYVWPLYADYEIFKTTADGKGPLVRLTSSPGYDAEGTVCGVDGSIIFTSVRDGDLELYRMDKDGGNVRRLTFTKGYDGGAFFNKDCSKIVWRASRPKPGPQLEEYERLLGQGLVRPSKLELYVANADGSEPRQVTSLDAASFAPFWFPDQPRIIFSSNVGDPKRRDFDLYAINDDGTDLERLTFTPGFDGFPMFSPDGRHLVFSSNRLTAEGKTDTDVYLAEWINHAPPPGQGGAERVRADVTALADPALEGRGVGTAGLERAGAFIEAQLAQLGLKPLGDDGGFRHHFEVPIKVGVDAGTALVIDGKPAPKTSYTPLGFSANGVASGSMVLAGWGLDEPPLNDYAGLDVKGKLVVVRRFVPDVPSLSSLEAQRRAGDLRKKAFIARNKGAKALLVVDFPTPVDGGAPMAEAPLPHLSAEGPGDSGLLVLAVKREVLEPVWRKLLAKKAVKARVSVALSVEKVKAFNVVGVLPPTVSTDGGVVVLGAHYDHLGLGGRYSMTPGKIEPHLGADDNASGVAGVLEATRRLKAMERTRPIVVAMFSGEEEGILGSSALVQSRPPWLSGAWAMVNLDMVGRLRANTVTVLGSKSAVEWPGLVERACDGARVRCELSGDGFGPSDHTSFFAAGLPVLHFFTGAHDDYHKPSDTAAKVHSGGVALIAEAVARLVSNAPPGPLTYVKAEAEAPRGDVRSFNASLGTVPNYAGPPNGQPGVLLDDVRSGGAAAKAGLKRGDIIIAIGKSEVRSVSDLMYVLMQARPGETVPLRFVREGNAQTIEVTFQEGRRR